MSDKHEAKQKAMRAKAHVGVPEHHAEHQNHTQLNDEGTEGQIKESAGNVQEELSKTRASANHDHQG
ncbi:MAG TPA: hypothetical protein VGK19_11595 [Capsulimonadaceae bacterium]